MRRYFYKDENSKGYMPCTAAIRAVQIKVLREVQEYMQTNRLACASVNGFVEDKISELLLLSDEHNGPISG